MTLLFLLLLLVGPYFVLTLIGRWVDGFKLTASKRARVGLSLFFLVTASQHFVGTQAMAAMLPPSIPYRIELVYLTGVLELLGAIGVRSEERRVGKSVDLGGVRSIKKSIRW